ncbi:MAG: AAA family ATPase [Planctomycetota bacterium]
MNWSELSKASSDAIVGWARTQPWAKAMANCQQDKAWHAEGDVWTHTEMVCNELVRLDEWSALSQRDQTILLFTALFHDAAKPLTTTVDPISGRTTSPKHAVKGELLARNVLRDLDCELEMREEIARMVRFHGRPSFLLERDQPAVEVARLSWLVSNRLLYLFALADTRGRHTEAMTRPEENLHLWKMESEENDCYHKRYPFTNDRARFEIFRRKHENLHYKPHEDYRSTVTLVAGLPGSGKDSWLRANRNDQPQISLDEIRRELGIQPTENQGAVAQFARERCRELLRSSTDFSFNATNVVRQTRQRWIELFVDYGARIEIVYIEPRMQTILQQNRQRTHQVPEKVIIELARKCDVPNWSECHDLMLVGDALLA